MTPGVLTVLFIAPGRAAITGCESSAKTSTTLHGEVAVKARYALLGVGIAVVAGALGTWLGLLIHHDQSSASGLAKQSTSTLTKDKLAQEVRQLQLSNGDSTGLEHNLLSWAPFAAAIGGIVTVGATLWKQSTDLATSRQQLVDEQQAQREATTHWQATFIEDQHNVRVQQETDSLRRFDGNLAAAITNLGSPSVSLQVNAAAALSTYLKPQYAEFHSDLLLVVAANLQLRPDPAVARVLGSDLERLLRLLLAAGAFGPATRATELDLSRASLARVDLTQLDLSSIVVDVAFADMKEARLEGATLIRLRGREVDLTKAYASRAILTEARLDGANLTQAMLHETNLVSATLKDANLSGAKLQRAKLQEAHFERANLTGANFTKADINNAYFAGAVFDNASLRSIAHGALHWRGNEHFDPITRAKLEELAPPPNQHDRT